jgi:hypothetical protein
MGHPGRVDRQRIGLYPSGVANSPVDDDASDPDLLRVREHELTYDCIGQVTAGVNYNDIPSAGTIKSGMHHKIIARALLDGKSDPRQYSAGMQRAKARSAMRHAVHGVADVGDSDGLELPDGCLLDLPSSRMNPEPDRHV